MAEDLKARITAILEDVYREHKQVTEVPRIADDDVLLETGLDSLGFALLVIRLEDELGFDPFVLSDTPYYPRTFGEFVRFYEAHQPA